jgi:ankyrin repeat protein
VFSPERFSARCFPNTKVDGSGLTLLHHAAMQNHVQAINALLSCRAWLGSVCSMGNTPLHAAAIFNAAEAASKLLQAGADPKAKNKQGMSPEDLNPALFRRPA